MERRSVCTAFAMAWFLAVGTLQGQTPTRPAKPAPARPATPAKRPAPTPAAPPPAPAVAQPQAPPSDVKAVTTYTQGAQVFENTTYIKGARQRVEFPGMVSLQQGDLHRTVMLSPATKRYRVQTEGGADAVAGAAPTAASAAPQAGGPNAQPAGGVVTLTTTLSDTLERKTIFGLEARHIKTVIGKQTDANACDKSPMRTEIDGWYVDLPKSASSAAKQAARPETPPAAGECRDRVDMRVVGDVSLGFPVKTVITTTTGETNKQETTTSTVEVTSLEVTSLDASLFEIPSDYTAASSSMELVPAVAGGASLEEALFGSTADGTSQAAPKKPGIVRIGVLEPVNKSTRTLNTRVLRQDLVGKFSKAPYEALPLSGSSADAIKADADRLACDYILLGEITEVKTSKPGKVGGFLKAATSGGGAPPKDVQDVKASYRMYANGATTAPKLTGDVKASSAEGFGLGSALKMASFAGRMYMGFGMMRTMRGFGGMGFDPMSAIASTGGFGQGGLNFFDPRSMAMSSAMSSMSMGMGMAGGLGRGGAADPSDGEVYQTISEAFDNIAKSASEKLAPRK